MTAKWCIILEEAVGSGPGIRRSEGGFLLLYLAALGSFSSHSGVSWTLHLLNCQTGLPFLLYRGVVRTEGHDGWQMCYRSSAVVRLSLRSSVTTLVVVPMPTALDRMGGEV